MDLSELGWNAFFERHFEKFKDEGLAPARIACEHKTIYTTYSEYGELAAEVSGKLRHDAGSRLSLPTVGDWVALAPRPEESKATIRVILPRKSVFRRKVAWVRTEEQVLAANIDTVFLMSALDRDFNLRRLERYLILTRESGANPVVVLNKADLCPDIDSHVTETQSIAPGVPIHAMSALTGYGLDALHEYMGSGRTVALLGSSGVGKSTLINRLLGTEQLRVGEVRQTDGRGRHITAARQLVLIPGAGMLLDAPGMRELQLWADERSLDQSFEDIEALALECRFRDCRHQSEPGCAVKQAIERGILDQKRLKGYLKLKKELIHLAIRKEERARLDQKARWKKISQRSRQLKKYR